MKKLNRIIALFTLSAAITTNVFAQDKKSKPDNTVERNYEYKNAIGIRAGGTSGITFKHFFNTGNAFEAILGIWPNAVGLTALYEKHTGTGVDGLKFYYGGGAHITGETGNYYYRTHRNANREYIYRYGTNGFGLGIDGIVGLDYKIGVIPLALSFDLKPYLEVSNYGTIFTAIDPSLGIKIAF
jgi:hypothetical protein